MSREEDGIAESLMGPTVDRHRPAAVSAHVCLNPASLDAKSIYKLLIGSVVPRPIAWVSTISTTGRRNLAPFSFCTIVSCEPPMVAVTFVRRDQRADTPYKDTLTNLKDTGEFVVNVVPAELAIQMARSSLPYDPGVDEFEEIGLTAIGSTEVRAPRVREAPIHMECRVSATIEPGSDVVAIGEVLRFHFREDVLLPNGRIDITSLNPLARLAGNYAEIGKPFAVDLDAGSARAEGRGATE